MPASTKPRKRPGQDRRRQQLHAAVDRILDGPGDGDIDAWVVQVLVGIGALIGAAAPALDYEAGRVISGVARPVGDFPSNSSWEGAAIRVDHKQANVWVAAGDTARTNRPKPATQQIALAAVIRPIANISCHSWLHDLVSALDALPWGEVHDIVTPSSPGIHGYKKGRSLWKLRLLALQWAEFQHRAKLMTKTEALGEVALAFGIRNLSSINDWEPRARQLLGDPIVEDALQVSRARASLYLSARDKRDSGAPMTPLVERDIKYGDRGISKGQLNTIARVYMARPRKRRKRTATP